MDSTTNRSSGLPRPTSRLPQPRTSAIPTPKPLSATTLRHPASTDSLRARSVQSSTLNYSPARLRTVASRDQLDGPTTTTSLRRPQRVGAPPVSSQAALRGARTADDGQFKIPLTPRKRLSVAQFEDPPSSSQDDLPPLTSSASEGLSSDSLGISKQSIKPTPSLSERTIETLSQLPSSPAIKRRGSNFFDSEISSRRPPSRAGSGRSRPGSSYQSDGSTGRPPSRPSSSAGPSEGFPNGSKRSANSYKPPMATDNDSTSRRISAVARLPRLAPTAAPATSVATANSPTADARGPKAARLPGSSTSTSRPKTTTARPLKSRASTGLLKKPSLTAMGRTAPGGSEITIRPPRKGSTASVKSSPTTIMSGEERDISSASTTSTSITTESVEEGAAPNASRKSSAALREQIARAKAAKRAIIAGQTASPTTVMPIKSPLIPTDMSFDFGLEDDPFNQNQFEQSNRKVMQSRIESARTTGRLNIAAMGLKQIPAEVTKMYDLESIEGGGGSWAESVDLTRFVAADNEFESIDASIFPDIDPLDAADDENGMGHQFGGLESLDLHGNTLIDLPIGLRRLRQLTSLNLAQNKLANSSLQIISQILPLRDLKLGGNLLYGKMDSCFSTLENLEILDLKGNAITALPDGFEKLARLRVLNINENAFESLPFGTLAMLPLTELLVHKNKLAGTLIDVDVERLPSLQTLDVSGNQLTLLALGPVAMPSLLQLTVSMNRLQALPDISSWNRLLTLTADENSISSIPDGFTDLESIKSADFTSNDIRTIPPEIARMDSLDLLRISGNPLRDKKFTSMTTEEVKDSLAARLQPSAEFEGGLEHFGGGFNRSASTAPVGGQQSARRQSNALPEHDEQDDSRSELDDFATPPTSAPQSPVRTRSHTLSSQTWPVKAGGILDRANTQSSSLHPVVCSKMVVEQTIREIRLQHNTFTSLPDSLSFFADTLTSLSVAHNQLVGGSYLGQELDLTALQELNLSHNHIASLEPLVSHLRAPNLRKLDVSFNRIVSLPALREAFPSLNVLLVSNNHLESLDPDSIAGVKIVAADNNDIAHLNPRLGLLGLERLDVAGNRFRVPRWNVLERGTEATLRWLRGRVPVAEMAEWKAKQGVVVDDGNLGDLD